MRGFTTQGTHGADTAVYIDGIPQNIPSSQGGAGHGPVYMEWMTPDMVGRVDVIKGPVSALYGDQNRAGAVNITTKNGGAATPSSIGMSVESYGGRRLSGVVSSEFNDIQSLFIAEMYRSDNYRHGSDVSRDSLFWKLSKTIGDGLYSVRASYYKSDFTAAGYLLLPALQAGLDPKTVQSNNPGFGDASRKTLVFNRTPANGEGGWYATAYAEQFERARGITASANSHNIGIDDRTILGGRLANNFVFGERASLFVGADIRQDKGDGTRQLYTNRVPNAAGTWVNNQHLDLLTYGVFAQGQYLATSNLKFTAGARYDKLDYAINNRKQPDGSIDYNDSVFTPKYGVVWTVNPKVDLFANVAQGFRSPSAEQLSPNGAASLPLGSPGGRTNPNIGFSKVRSYDLGFNTKPTDGLIFNGAVFYTINEDEIIGNAATGIFESVGDTTRKGFELETQYKLNAATSIYASYGRIFRARVNETNTDLSVPRHQYKAGVEHRMPFSAGRLLLNADAYLTTGNPYYSGAPLTKSEMPSYARYDLKATYDYKKTQTSLFAVFQPHKFGTEVAYGTAAGLMLAPMPGTHFGVSFRYFF